MALILGNNLADTLCRRVTAGPGRTAMLRKQQGVWTTVTWKEYERAVFEVASALRREGVQAGDRVAILSQTRPEWTFADLAILSLGAVTVPVYPSVTADDIHFILKDADVKFVFIEGSAQREKLEAVRPRLPALKGFVSFDEPAANSGALGFRAWLDADANGGAGFSREAWRAAVGAIDSQVPATIVYTSGTEGFPKGAMLTHANFLQVLRDATSVIRVGEQDLTLFFLPAAHILGRIEQMLALAVGWTNAYVQDQASLMDNLVEVRPTVIFAVPRIYEKIREGILRPSREGNLAKTLWMDWVVGSGRRRNRALRSGERPGKLGTLQHDLVDRFVLQKIRARFGGRLRFAVSGGAPLAVEIAEFFHACGLLILEGYGLTETTGPIAFNTPDHYKFGSVGRPFPSAEFDFADDGEILVRGPTVAAGYIGRASEGDGAFRDGWFHTGDVGILDADGYLKIVDRKKDLIITSSGKNIAPLKLEQRLREIPLISHALIAGDRKNYLVAVFTVNIDEARKFCERNKITFRSLNDLVRDETFLNHLRAELETVNATLPSYERIRNFRVLTRDFTIEAGELTPSLKVKRIFCTKKYAETIEEMYR